MIRVIGDSHVSVLSGRADLQPCWPKRVRSAFAGVETIRLGSYLAYSVTRSGHMARRKLMAALRTSKPNDTIVLSFGEIDCRCHVVRQAELRKVPIATVARELAREYVHAARALVPDRGLFFLCAPPTSPVLHRNTAWARAGTFEQRRRAVQAFNRELKRVADKAGYRAIDVTGTVLGVDGRANPLFAWDGLHLGRATLPAIVQELRTQGAVSDREFSRMRVIAERLARTVKAPSRAFEPTKEELRPQLTRDVVSRCVQAGVRSVAIFGAGAHTRRMGVEPFEQAGIRVSVIFDDNPRQVRMLGRQIRRPTEQTQPFEAVVVSSDTFEEVLHRRAVACFGDQVPILRIYGNAA